MDTKRYVSIDLVYHHYRQLKPSTVLRDTRLRRVQPVQRHARL